MQTLKQTHADHLQRVQSELLGAARHSQDELHLMTKQLENRVREKETECEQLIRYQEEFRDEYVKVCASRDDLDRRSHS